MSLSIKTDITDITGAEADDETGDEVKVFRTNDTDDSTDIASSSAELTADKKDLALEAENESGIGNDQRIPHLQSAFNMPPMPSPSFNFLYPMFMSAPLSPLHQQIAAYTAAQTAINQMFILKNSPNYTQLNNAAAVAAAGVGGFLPNGAPNPMQFLIRQNMSNMSSPLSSMSNGINGMSLTERQQQQQQNPTTPTSIYRNCHHQDLPTSSSSSAITTTTTTNNTNNNGNSTPNSTTQLKTPKREKLEKISSSSAQQQQREEKREKNHIKKPCNAFMWFMKENRMAILAKEGGQQKQSALLNQKLGKMWQEMSKQQQQKYYDMAAAERDAHQKKYPMWTARENYAIHKKKKKKREKSMASENNDQKKCRARYGVDHQEMWCKHCRRKKRCLNVRDVESPMVSSTTSTTTPMPLSQQQQQPLNLMQTHHMNMNSPSSSGIMSEKRSESTTSISDAGASPHSNHLKYGGGGGGGGGLSTNSGKTSPIDNDFEIPKPTPTHSASAAALNLQQQQQQQFLNQQQQMANFVNFLPSTFMSSPYFQMGSPNLSSPHLFK